MCGRSPVHAALGGAVADEVLRGRDDARCDVVALEAAHERDAHAPDEIRILAERLLEAAPARIAADVENGPETLMHARGAHLRPDRVGQRFDERGLPRAGEPDRLREDRRVARHQPGADLLVHDGGNTEPRVVDQMALERVRELGRLLRSQAARAGDARDLADPVPQQVVSAGVEPAVAARELEDPAAAELRHLLLGRHACEQVVDALVDRLDRVAVERLVLVDLERAHASATRGLHDARSTSRVGRTTCGGRFDGSSIRPSSMRTASSPMRWMGCSIVVSGGSQSADSGTLSKPITERSPGHRQAERMRDRDRLDRRCVVGREDRGRPRLSQQQVARRLACRLGLVLADANEARVERNARGVERLPVALLAQPGRLEIGAPGDEADSAMAEIEQVLRGGDGAVQVVRVDGRKRRRPHVVVDRDDRRGRAEVDAARRHEHRAVASDALTRASERRSQPTWSSRWPQSEKTTRS